MKSPSKRVTVFCRQEDIELLLELCQMYNGASDSDLFRLGLRALSGQKPLVQVRPQLPPIAGLIEFLAKLSSLSRLLETAVRNGWPDHLPGESQRRYATVEDARKQFANALAEIKPTLQGLFAVVAVSGCVNEVDIAAVRRAVRAYIARPSSDISPGDAKCFAHFATMVGFIDTVSGSRA